MSKKSLVLLFWKKLFLVYWKKNVVLTCPSLELFLSCSYFWADFSLNVLIKQKSGSGKTFLDDGHAAVVGLGFEGGVGIKLGGSSLNIDGGLTGRIFSRTMVNPKLADQCRLHTTVSGGFRDIVHRYRFSPPFVLWISWKTKKQWLYSHHQNYH